MNLTPQGYIGLDKGRMIPIFGLDCIPLGREANWSENIAGIAVQSAIYYQGTRMMEFPFRFKLTVGVTVATAAELRQHMITLHQMLAPASGSGDGLILNPPKPGRLILSNMVNTKGMLLQGEAIGEKPFRLEGQYQVPLCASFSGTFRALPSYDGKLVDVTQDAERITGEAIESRFYQL